MMMTTKYAFFAAAVLAGNAIATAAALQCPKPQGGANYTNAAFAAVVPWREIGKYQTYNPFENGCVCTAVSFNDTVTPYQFHTSCTKGAKEEKITATLTPIAGESKGVFTETFSFGPVKSNARLVIVEVGVFPATGEHYLIEFDCEEHYVLPTSYCFHAFTPSGKASAALVKHVQGVAAKLELNPDNLEWATTDQTGCPAKRTTWN